MPTGTAARRRLPCSGWSPRCSLTSSTRRAAGAHGATRHGGDDQGEGNAMAKEHSMKDEKDKKDKMISRAYHAATAQNPDFNPRESDIGDLIPAMQKLLPGVTAEEIRWWRDATDFWQELSSIGNAIQGEGADVVRRQLLGLNEYMCRWFDDHPDVASNI